MHFGNSVTFMESLFISVFAMVVVFIVLLLISYLINITAKIVSGKKGKKEESPVQPSQAAQASQVSQVKAREPEISSRVDAKTVAIITCAIDSFRKDEDPNYIIKSIK